MYEEGDAHRRNMAAFDSSPQGDTEHLDSDSIPMGEDVAKKAIYSRGPHRSSLTHKQRRDMAASDPICLPAEIWGQVLSHIDDFTLWVACRQVSKMIRAEAEREFARTRLAQVYFKRDFFLDVDVESVINAYAYMGSCKIVRMANVPTNSARVTFDVRFKYWLIEYSYWDDIKPEKLLEPWIPEVTELVRKKLTDYDLIGEDRDAAFVFMGRYVNEVDIPGLEIDFDNHQVSFLWKSFLNAFFQDEAYVRAKRKALGLHHKPYPVLRQLRAIKAPSAKVEDKDFFLDWFDGENSTVCELDAELYKKAFMGRNREIDRRSLSDSRISKRMEYWTKRLERARRRYLCLSIAKKQGSWGKDKEVYSRKYFW